MAAPFRFMPCNKCCGCAYFSDRFGRDELGSNWTVLDGEWAIDWDGVSRSGVLMPTSSGAVSRILCNTPSVEKAMSVDVKGSAGDRACILLGYDGPDPDSIYYVVEITFGVGVSLFRAPQGGAETLLWSVALDVPVDEYLTVELAFLEHNFFRVAGTYFLPSGYLKWDWYQFSDYIGLATRAGDGQVYFTDVELNYKFNSNIISDEDSKTCPWRTRNYECDGTGAAPSVFRAQIAGVAAGTCPEAPQLNGIYDFPMGTVGTNGLAGTGWLGRLPVQICGEISLKLIIPGSEDYPVEMIGVELGPTYGPIAHFYGSRPHQRCDEFINIDLGSIGGSAAFDMTNAVCTLIGPVT